MADPVSYWRDQLRPASFRGVEFEVISRGGQGGRQIAKHIFPQRDDQPIYPEDLGRLPREFSLSAFLIGSDYHIRRDKLIEALEAKGPGELIDRWGRSGWVACTSFNFSEKLSEGGYIEFQLSFCEAGKPILHEIRPDRRAATLAAADLLDAAAGQDFENEFSADGDLLDQAAAMLDGLFGAIDDMLAAPGLLLAQVGAVRGLIANAQAGLMKLLSAPGNLFQKLLGLLSGLFGSFEPGWPRWNAAKKMRGYGSDFAPVLGTTPTRLQQAANQDALIMAVRNIALAEEARATADIPFTVYDDAVTIRDDVASHLDERMLTASDPLYGLFSRLRVAVVRDISERGTDLTRLTDIKPAATIPALLLAHRLYGDASRETDVIERNPVIRHPGFVPGGVTLKVPTND